MGRAGLSGGRRGFALLSAAALIVCGALMLLAPDGGSAADVPIVATDLCVNPAQGQLSYPVGGSCPAGYQTVAVDDPSATFQTCYLNSNGAIRKVASPGDCTTAPRSKNGTPRPLDLTKEGDSLAESR